MAPASLPLSVTSSLSGVKVPLSDCPRGWLKEVQHRWLPLAAKTLPAMSRERFQPAAASAIGPALFAVARVPFFSWYSCYAPLRQKTTVTRLETAERSRATVDSSGAPCEARVAQTSFARRLRSRNSCVTSHVTLYFFFFQRCVQV